jgi:hypothetical protein
VIPYSELEAFFCDLVSNAQRQGITCAITSGMACVHFGVAATTMDCDVLCKPEQSDAFRALVGSASLRGLFPNYRGNICQKNFSESLSGQLAQLGSPPLDARWLKGGWTSHFTWKTKPDETCLDIFGIAPRGSSAWENELMGLYASRHTVAEMQRTNREKDWPYITALGIKMLKEGDARGVFHLYDAEMLSSAGRGAEFPEWMLTARPTLRLAQHNEPQLPEAIHAETVFWHMLDACRIKLYEKALRPYVNAVRKALAGKSPTLEESHTVRMQCASDHLPPTPISNHGFSQLVSDAREATESRVHPSLMKWLPNGLNHFIGML